MKKVAVIQCHFGKGYMSREEQEARTAIVSRQIIERCKKSVKSWSDFHGYDYTLITEKPELNYESVNTDLAATELEWSYYQYKCFPKEGYDYIVFLDNDIFITELENEVPLGDWLCSTTHDPIRNAFLQNKLHPLAAFWNASILVMSQERANHLSDWMVSCLEGKFTPSTWNLELRKQYPYYNSHEMLLSYYCYHEAVPEHLPPEWHCRPSRYVDYEKAKMIHLDGQNKDKHLLLLPKKLLAKFNSF